MSKDIPKWKSVLDVIGAALAVDEIDAFGPVVLEALASVVPYELGSFNEVDPQAGRAVFCVRPQSYETDREEPASNFPRLAHQNPLLMYHGRTGDGSAKRLSDFLDREQLHRLELYQKVYRALGVEYQVAIALPARAPLVIGIALNRPDHDFANHELVVLDTLRPHLIQAYRNVRALGTLKALSDGLEVAGRSAVVVGSAPQDVHASDWAMYALERYFGPGRPGQLPEAVASWLAEQRQQILPGGEPRLGRPLAVMVGASRLTIRFIAGTGPRPDVIVIDEQASERSASQLHELGLTRREAEILWHLTRGATTPEVASRLGLRPATVSKHLQHIYRKLGVTNRTAAVAVASDALFSDH